MKLATAGQFIRIVGLASELLGIMGIWFISSKGVEAFGSFLGDNPNGILKALVVFGFILWLVGRSMISIGRARDARPESGQGRPSANDLRL
jgi:hypothetical protein